MKISLLIGLGLITLLSGCSQKKQESNPPATRKQPVTDTYFGKAVVDDYRWIEDMNSHEVKDWFKAQGDYTNTVLDQIPGRDSLINTFVQYDALRSVRYADVRRRGNRYFYRKTLASENVGKLYFREGKTGAEVLLFDPVTYDKGKTYSISGFSPSDQGTHVAIGLQEGGAEISTLRTIAVGTKTFLPESITAVFGGGVTWLADGKGFLYTPQNSMDTKDPQGTLNTKARLHQLGANPTTDPALFSKAKYPALGIQSSEYPLMFFSDDYTQLYGFLSTVDRRANVWMASPAELTKPEINWQRLAAPKDSVISFLKMGNRMFLQSIKGAPNGKMLVTDASKPNLQTASVVLAEGKRNITSTVSTKDFVFVTLNDGINDYVKQYDVRTNQWADIPLPLTGSVGLSLLDAPRSNDVMIYVSSWKQPTTTYDYDPSTKKLVISPFNVTVNYPGVADLVVEEVEVPSHDGTMVPLSLIYRKDLKKDGSAVCFMTGYGAYGSSATPYFSTRYLGLLNKGVIVAETHPRGGSEKGQNWYKAGFKTTKPNTWKDFIASGEWLIKNGYTSAGKLIGEGTSAGGVLIGRAITERPDLFAAAISNVSCSNTLRAEQTPNGPVNAPEFGTVKDSTECMALYEMDAMHHVKEGTKYPAVMCIGGMNDPRVIAWQPGKFAAALQNASTSGKPVLLQVNYDNGHFTEDKKVTFRNFSNMYAFALWQAGHPDFQPKK
jgi:prolyl oligopeptidase